MPDSAIAERLRALAPYRQGDSRVPLLAVEELVYSAGREDGLRRQLASAMAEMLGGDASVDCKNCLCRHLRFIGSSEEAAALGALLADESLGDMARYALAGIGGPEAERLLRDAAARASERLRTGLRNELSRQERA